MSSSDKTVMIRGPLGIAVTSALIMALELALIRFLPAEVKALSYFSNLILFASFFGLGLGCILHDTRPRPWALPLGIFLIYLYTHLSHGIVSYNTNSNIHFWLQRASQDFKPLLQIPIELSAITAFILVAIPFFTLGHLLANQMDQYDRLSAYAWDIGGSLVGTVVATAAALVGVPPYILIALVPVILVLNLRMDMDRRVGFLVAGACFLVFSVGRYDSRWSPYYLISFIPGPNTLSVFVNSSFHQEAVNFSATENDYRPVANRALAKFSVPYNEYKNTHQGIAPNRVLILGGGTGNDANVALLNGASSVTVVEIDPVIINLGREYNFLQPYQDPKVSIINDDARHYLSETKDRFDMVIFGTLDSQALLSGYANLRLENYVYTEESFRDARGVLNPTGILGTYYSIWQDWFLGRIYATVAAAFPGSIKMMVVEDGYLFNTIVVAAKDLPGFNSDPKVDERFLSAKKSTDDWPYIYLEQPTISRLYWIVIGALSLLILAAFFILKIRKARLGDPDGARATLGFGAEFFLLGLAFTLLESAAIVRLALLFGTTWMVNSLVFVMVLTTILLSNWIVKKRGGLPMMVSWIGLAIAMAANILVPLQVLIGLGFWAKFGASLALVGIPVLLAGNAFSQMFARQERTGYALGVNLIGAMGGGLIEYVSMLFGMRSVWIVLTLIYGAAFLVWMRKYRDVDAPSVAHLKQAAR